MNQQQSISLAALCIVVITWCIRALTAQYKKMLVIVTITVKPPV